MTSIPCYYYLEISPIGAGGALTVQLTPEMQEVPAKRLSMSLYPSLVGTKAQQENRANQRGFRSIHKGRGLGINGLFNFRIS